MRVDKRVQCTFKAARREISSKTFTCVYSTKTTGLFIIISNTQLLYSTAGVNVLENIQKKKNK